MHLGVRVVSALCYGLLVGHLVDLLSGGMFLRSVAGMRAAPMIPTVEMAQELIEYVVYMAVGFGLGVDVSLEGGVGCDGP